MLTSALARESTDAMLPPQVMSRHILCSVGTSLLTNDQRPWTEAYRGPEKTLPDPAVVDHWLRNADRAKATAETNSLQALEFNATDCLALLHSDTPAGRFCAEALQRFYSPQCRSATIEKIAGLGYGVKEFTRGLKGLVDRALALTRKARELGYEPVYCATGGFKAEIAFLNLLGALLEVEVMYMHEQHRELVRLPRLPLAWDPEVVIQHQGFFEWIEDEPRNSHEVESRLHQAPELRSLVEDDAEGHTMLSAAGDLLYRAAKAHLQNGPRATWPAADPRPPAEKNSVSKEEHHRPRGWERVVDRLCRIDCVTSVRFDNAARGAEKARILDAASGVLGLSFGDTHPLPLRIDTTARGLAQCELVAAYLRNIR